MALCLLPHAAKAGLPHKCTAVAPLEYRFYMAAAMPFSGGIIRGDACEK